MQTKHSHNNSDIDGDHMGIHIPHCVVTNVEKYLISNARNRMVNPKNSRFLPKIVQDTLMERHIITHNDNWINEYKYLPMFDFILPFQIWERIKNEYDFNYDLHLLCFVRYTENCFFFSVNRKLKNNCVIPLLPNEIWEIILSRPSRHVNCDFCGKKFMMFNKLFLVSKLWYKIMAKIIPTEKSDMLVITYENEFDIRHKCCKNCFSNLIYNKRTFFFYGLRQRPCFSMEEIIKFRDELFQRNK